MMKLKKMFAILLTVSTIMSLLGVSTFAMKNDGHLSVTNKDTDCIVIDDVKYHAHNDKCFPLKCWICENQEHTHTEECYSEGVLTCNTEEHKHTLDCCEAGHSSSGSKPYHTSKCYDTLKAPICGFEAATADMICELACLDNRTPEVYNISAGVTPGEAPYVFQWGYTYQASTHQGRYQNESVESTPQIMMLLDTVAVGDYWEPNGEVYIPSVSNYTLTYCCDMLTKIDYSAYYRQVNLEDAEYYTENEASHIRAIVSNSYPFISFDQMLQNMYNAGYIDDEELDLIDYSDVLAGVQFAIWSYANKDDVSDIDLVSSIDKNIIYDGVHYAGSSQRTATSSSGSYKTYLSIGSAHNPEGTNVNYFYPAVSERIEKIKNYLFSLSPVEEEASDIIISQVEVAGMLMTPEDDGTYTVDLQVMLNSEYDNSNPDTNITITATAGNATASVTANGGSTYTMKLEGYNAGDDITVTMSGTQYLPAGVYFYEPYTEDGSDIRATSQNLVGMNEGIIPVGDSVTLPAGELATESLVLNKVNETGELLSDAEFELAYVDDEGITTALGTYITDANGEVTIEGLMAGKSYQLTETKAPEGYDAISGTVEFTVGENGKTIVFNLPDGVTCNDEADETYILTVVNCETPTTPPSDDDGGNDDGGNDDGEIITPPDVTVDDPEVPEDTETEIEEIIDEDVPLAPAPVLPENTESDIEEIIDEDVPLADVPQTGDETTLWLALSVLSAIGLVGVSLLGRKKRSDEE